MPHLGAVEGRSLAQNGGAVGLISGEDRLFRWSAIRILNSTLHFGNECVPIVLALMS
jgi:hypothetical protein